jgi:hypothetical protein
VCVDIDEYLPSDMLEWCSQQLIGVGINLGALNGGDVINDGSKAHVQAYGILRDIVQRHIDSGLAPFLSESPKPDGGYTAIEAQGGMLAGLLQENGEFVRDVEEGLAAELNNPDMFSDFEVGDDWDGRRSL